MHNLYRNNIKRGIVHTDISECVIRSSGPGGSSYYCHYWVEAGFDSLSETVKTWEVAQGMKVQADLILLRRSLVRPCLCFDPTCCWRLPQNICRDLNLTHCLTMRELDGELHALRSPLAVPLICEPMAYSVHQG